MLTYNSDQANGLPQGKYETGKSQKSPVNIALIVIFAIALAIFFASLAYFGNTGKKLKIIAPPGKTIIYPPDGPPRVE